MPNFSIRVPPPSLIVRDADGFIEVRFRTRLEATYSYRLWTITRDSHIWFIQFFGDLARQLLGMDVSQGLDIEGHMPKERITSPNYADVELIALSCTPVPNPRTLDGPTNGIDP